MWNSPPEEVRDICPVGFPEKLLERGYKTELFQSAFGSSWAKENISLIAFNIYEYILYILVVLIYFISVVLMFIVLPNSFYTVFILLLSVLDPETPGRNVGR